MAETEQQRDIARIFAEGRLIDQAIAASVKKALQEHKRAGNPIAVWQNGGVVWVEPEFIPA